MPEKIAIVTDSTSDIPVAQLEAEGIAMVPLSIFFGEEEFLDGVDLDPEQFYARLAENPHFPTTAQPPPGKFLNVYQELEKNGTTHILSLHISRKLSGTSQSAQVAANMLPQLTVQVLDSKMASWGLGNLVLWARTLVRQGMVFSQLVREVEEQIPRTTVYFSLDSLDALERGGRIGKARAFIGKYLGIRPIMVLQEGRGEIEVVKTVRSSKAVIAEIVRLAKLYQAKYGVRFQATVLEGVKGQPSSDLFRVLKASGIPFPKLVSGKIGGVIGTHLGPSGIGLVLC